MPEDNTPATPTASFADSNTPVLPTVSAGSSSSIDSPSSSNPAAQAAPSVPTPSEHIMSDVIVDPTRPPEEPIPSSAAKNDTSIYDEVASKIREAKNVLIALSSDPSVDEMAAAIGLSLYLDKLGKRATAIYSGSTPNALEFLKPEETFEPTADTLQDFVIALNKEKADHLRYKLDGDFVKIYITPYKTRISEEDLDFSYGDYNVDLVLALDVANGIDLDSALREHGRIMHDAVIINITTGNPGKFGEIEWSEKTASSVSEMIAKLIYSKAKAAEFGKEEATAFLTGIVAATNRFSNASTTPETMKIASKLMESGANQQLVSKNITPDIENELVSSSTSGLKSSNSSSESADPTKLEIAHGKEAEELEAVASDSTAPTGASESAETPDASQEVNATITEKESSLLDDLKAAEASLSNAGAEITSEPSKAPLKIDSSTDAIAASTAPSEPTPVTPAPEPIPAPEPVASMQEVSPAEAASEVEPAPTTEPASTVEPTPAPEPTPEPAPTPEPLPEPTPTSEPVPTPASEPAKTEIRQAEKVIQPPADFEASLENGNEENKYGQMLEDALASLNNAAPIQTMPAVPAPAPDANPAAMGAPTVPANPEINGVPEINYLPMPNGDILPPPPAPPIDMSQISAPVMPTIQEPSMPTTPQPMQPPVSTPAQPSAPAPQPVAPSAPDPTAFKIPGM